MSTNIIKYPNYFSRLFYYLTSLIYLFFGVKNSLIVVPRVFQRKETTITLNNNFKFHVRDLMELWTVKETILDDSYLINKYVNKDSEKPLTVVDIGGALGDFSIYCAKMFKNSKVYLFEPQNESCKQAMRNMELNMIDSSQIIISNTAVSNSENKEEYIKKVSINNLVRGEMVFDENCQTSETVEIKFSNFNIFLKNLNKDIDILKVDCEGGEYNIFPTIDTELMKRIKLIVMEWHEFNPNQDHRNLVNFFEKSGYKVTVRKSPVHNEIGYIFASRE